MVDNRLLIETEGVERVTVWLNERLVDFDKPLGIFLNQSEQEPQLVLPSLKTLCDSMSRSGDPLLAFSARLEVSAANTPAESRVQETTSSERSES